MFKKMTEREKGLREKAESGDADAMIQLFLDYAHGTNDIKANEQIAVRWFWKQVMPGLWATKAYSCISRRNIRRL